MSDPFLTLIATLIVLAGIGASAIAFAVLAPTPGSWQKGLLAMRPKPPTNILPLYAGKIRLTPFDWHVIRLTVDVELVRLKASPCPDLSTKEQAKLLADFEALSEKLKGVS